jgi:diguanylate cyclase (GGDEF)-like protein/PAS domain S-box-containing protein
MLRPLVHVKLFQRLQFRLAVVMILAGFALVGADVAGIWTARQEALGNSWAESTNLASSLADQTHGVLQMMETVLTGMRDQVETDGTTPPSLARLGRMLTAARKALPMLHGLTVLDSQGRPLVRPDPAPPPGFDFAGSAYFRHHRGDPGRAPFVGWPVRDAADGTMQLTVSSRIDRPDGGFAGVVVASIPVTYLQDMFAGFDVGQHGVISMLRADGVLIARRPRDAPDIGQVVAKMQPPGQDQRSVTESPLDGETRLESGVWVDNAPVVLRVGRSKADVLAAWHVMAVFHGIGLVLVLAGLSSLSWRLAASIGESERAAAALRRTNEQLEQSEALTARANRMLEMAEEVARVGHWRLTLADGYSLTWSDEVYRLHGMTKTGLDLTPEHVINAYHPEDRDTMRDAIRRTIATGIPFETVARILWQDGSVRHLLTRGFFQAASGGAPPSVFGVIMDVTEQIHAEAALLEANAKAEAANAALESANHALQALVLQDSLTGLSNRRHFDRGLGQEFRRAVRTGTSIGLILIDVDLFKQFNDTYGHQAGDACLRAIAATIPPLLNRPGDIAARYGGEEIALLLPGTAQPGACALAERVAQAVRNLAIPHAGSEYGIVTISAGVEAFVPVRELDTEAELLEHADMALYGAKHAGRDRVFCYGDLPHGAEAKPLPMLQSFFENR